MTDVISLEYGSKFPGLLIRPVGKTIHCSLVLADREGQLSVFWLTLKRDGITLNG